MMTTKKAYACFMPECLGGCLFPPGCPDYVDAPAADDAPTRWGTLGFRRWDRCLGFLEEDHLDEYERAIDDDWALLPGTPAVVILMRATLYRLPKDYYAEYCTCERFGQLNKEIACFRALWLRLCFPEEDFTSDPLKYRAGYLWRGFWSFMAGESFLHGEGRKTIARLLLREMPGAQFCLEDTLPGVTSDVITSEAIYRNLAFQAVKCGILESIDAYAAGVPAEYL